MRAGVTIERESEAKQIMKATTNKASSRKVDISKIKITKPRPPKVLPASVEWVKKGKDTTCYN